MAAKDRLTPKTKPQSEANASIPLNVSPRVQMKMPEIKIPEIKIPDINIPAADMGPVAAVLEQAMAVIGQVAQQQQAILQVLQQLASKEMNVTVEPSAVTVNNPKRPRSYYVEFDHDGDKTVGMRISAE